MNSEIKIMWTENISGIIFRETDKTIFRNKELLRNTLEDGGNEKILNAKYLQAVISLLGAIAVNACLNKPEASLGYSYSIWAVLLWAAWFLGLRKAAEEFEEKRKRRLLPCFLFALMFAGSMAAGGQLEQRGELDFADWHIYGATLALAVALAPIIEWVIWRLENGTGKPVEEAESVTEIDLRAGKMKFFWLAWG